MTVPKKPGTYTVRMKNGQTRRVQRLASGRVKFLKGGGSTTRRRTASTSRSAPAKRRTTPRRQTPMARKKTSRKRGTKTFSLLGGAVALNAIAQTLEPYISHGAIQAIQSGDVAAFIASLKAGTKEAVSFANILQAAGPAVTLGVMKKLARSLSITAPKFANVRAW